MKNIRKRLQDAAARLEQIERRRLESKNPDYGRETEWRLVDFELRDLERDIVANPGALESQLVRVRPAKR